MTVHSTPVNEEEHGRTGGVSAHMRGVVHLYEQADEDIVALRGVDFDIEAGEMVALLGPSGMGKSTVLRLLAGMMRPSAGQVLVGEVNLARAPARELQALRALEVGYVLQDTGANLLPYASAIQNIRFAQQGARSRGRTQLWQPEALLDVLGVGGEVRRPVAELPRGTQQLVALAAAVAPSPRLLLADEPTSQLDSDASGDVIALLQRINSALGTTVVIVTHDPQVARALPRTATIRDGRVGAEGHRGEEYAVIDGAGSVQLPPEVLEVLTPGSLVRVVRGEDGVQLRRIGPTT